MSKNTFSGAILFLGACALEEAVEIGHPDSELAHHRTGVDGLQSQRAVGGGAGKNDPNRPLTFVPGQR